MINFDWEAWLAEVDKFEDELIKNHLLSEDEALGYLARMPKEMQDMLHGNLSFGSVHQYMRAGILLRALTILPVTVGRPYIFAYERSYVNISVFCHDKKLDFIVGEETSLRFKLYYHDAKADGYSCHFTGDAAVTKKLGRARLMQRLLSFLED